MDKIIAESNSRSAVKYGSLDGLRALAAIGIVAVHVYKNMDNVPVGGPIWNAISHMESFVSLFLILSAFSLCCGYFEKITKALITPYDFYKRRIIRIWPFFAVMVLIDIVYNHNETALFEGFADLSLIFGLLPEHGIKTVGVAWFIGLIFVFYMIFPFYCYLIGSKRRAWFVLCLSICWMFLLKEYFHKTHFTLLLWQMPLLIAGGLLFYIKIAFIIN